MARNNPALEAIRNGTPPGSAATAGTPAASVAPTAVPAQGLAPAPVEALAAAAKPSKDVAKVMLYLPPKVARKFKEIGFVEDRKAHDVYLDALDLYLTQQGHGGLKGVTER
ncbi:hypothetical protein [Methylobacterium segetis]|uniref:hypothetical protein n=1 Tax=Methylobacterium segetis TaxID=2488750 RepID=UPI0010458DFB|nr:hypothetical protein [Methylobacterium segetis]